MLNTDLEIPFNPPVQYSLIWLIIAGCLLTSVVMWYGFVVWHTRRKPLKSLDGLKVLTDEEKLRALKRKYLLLVNEGYEKYQRKQTSLRGLHRGLSMAVRYFVYEAAHFPAPRLTLADLERAPYPKLTRVIASYYRQEFATIESGDPTSAVQAARELIEQWT